MWGYSMQDDISCDEFILPLLQNVQEYVSICNSCKIANYSLQLTWSDNIVEIQDSSSNKDCILFLPQAISTNSWCTLGPLPLLTWNLSLYQVGVGGRADLGFGLSSPFDRVFWCLWGHHQITLFPHRWYKMEKRPMRGVVAGAGGRIQN